MDEEYDLTSGWELACTEPGERAGPEDLQGLSWGPAVVPGTVAAARPELWEGLEERDWWFRTSFAAPPADPNGRLELIVEGVATVAETYLNGSLMFRSESMFAEHRIALNEPLPETSRLVICCRALAPLLRRPRRPRARWRTRLVNEPNLRFYRTMLLGRAPGFAPGPPAVGPWRPVRLVRRRGAALHDVRLRARLQGGTGVVSIDAEAGVPLGVGSGLRAELELTGPEGSTRGPLRFTALQDGRGRISGELTVADPQLWWPHTHGHPHLYRASVHVSLGAEQSRFDLGRVGFRTLTFDGDPEREGLALRINGVRIFARGAVWCPPEIVRPHSAGQALERRLRAAVDAGMNMVRLPGTACYESDEFYDRCDELGILLWQDFMFANLDYPEADEAFMDQVEREAEGLMARLGGRPSLAVLCGGSEVAQQVAMVGLDPELVRGPLFGDLLPRVIDRAGVDALYLPSTPWGGVLPFRPGAGIAHYYGVGAYLRPLTDARLAEVRFAAEALAFANVPDDAALEPAPRDQPQWQLGVPRDVGAGWDFADVRDHYLRELFGVDPVALRAADGERYLELSRALSGQVMGEVLGEWRRTQSSCAGALVLWLADLYPGSGWGLLDHRGEPKLAYHDVRRALAPLAVWSTDEGLGGIDVHAANDGPTTIEAKLRVALYRDCETLVEEREQEVELAPHAGLTVNLEQLLGRFVDASWAYRFGPPAQDLIVISLEQGSGGGATMVSQAFRFPAGRPNGRETARALGASAAASRTGEGTVTVSVACRKLLYGVRLTAPGFRPTEEGFSVEPGRARAIELVRVAEQPAAPVVTVSALNLVGRMAAEVPA